MRKNLRKGFGIEAVLVTMAVCMALGVILLAIVSFSAARVARSVDWLDDKRLLDVIGEEFAADPPNFYKGNYAPFYSLGVAVSDGEYVLEVYERDEAPDIIDAFCASPTAFSVEENSGRGYVVSRTFADGAITLRLTGGDALLARELNAYPLTDENGYAVTDEYGAVYAAGGEWTWETREAGPDGELTTVRVTGSEREWRAAHLKKLLIVRVAGGVIAAWRYGDR